MFSFIEGDDLYSEKVSRSKEAGREITRAVYAFHRMTENALKRVASEEEVDQLLMLAKYEIEDCVSEYMPTISDPQAKLRKALRTEGLQLVVSKKVAAEDDASKLLSSGEVKIQTTWKPERVVDGKVTYSVTLPDGTKMLGTPKAEKGRGKNDATFWREDTEGKEIEGSRESVKTDPEAWVVKCQNEFAKQGVYYTKQNFKKKTTGGSHEEERTSGPNGFVEFYTINDTRSGDLGALNTFVTIENSSGEKLRLTTGSFETKEEYEEFRKLVAGSGSDQTAKDQIAMRAISRDIFSTKEKLEAAIEKLSSWGASPKVISTSQKKWVEEDIKKLEKYLKEAQEDIDSEKYKEYGESDSRGRDKETAEKEWLKFFEGQLSKAQESLKSAKEYQKELEDKSTQDDPEDNPNEELESTTPDAEDDRSDLDDYSESQEEVAAYIEQLEGELGHSFDDLSEEDQQAVMDAFDAGDDPAEIAKNLDSGYNDDEDDESNSPEAEFEDALAADPASTDVDGDGEPDTGKTYKGKDKDGNEQEGKLVKMIFGKPKIVTDSGEEVMLHEWE